MSDVRAKAGVPVIADFAGVTTPTQCAPLIVDSTTGNIYSWVAGDTIILAGNVLAPSQTSGTWTPVLTFATPGDLAVTYSNQAGDYVKIGRLVTVNWIVVTSAFTWTTAAGALRISGLPFAAGSTNNFRGSVAWGGITKVGYTQVIPLTTNTLSTIGFSASASALASSTVVAADVPSAGTVALGGSISYISAT